MGGGRGISLRGERAKTHNEGEHGFSENRRPRVLETPDPTFFTVEKVTPSRRTTRTSQGSPPSDAFFPVDLPHPARGAHSSLEGPPGALGDPPQATPLGGPGPRCAARMRRGGVPPCSRPGSFWERGRSGFSALTFLSPGNSSSPPGSPGPVTGSEPGPISPPETNLRPRRAPDCNPGEPALRPATALCSWKDRPSYKTHAIFQEPLQGPGVGGRGGE